jgi:hypothetical protein
VAPVYVNSWDRGYMTHRLIMAYLLAECRENGKRDPPC